MWAEMFGSLGLNYLYLQIFPAKCFYVLCNLIRHSVNHVYIGIYMYIDFTYGFPLETLLGGVIFSRTVCVGCAAELRDYKISNVCRSINCFLNILFICNKFSSPLWHFFRSGRLFVGLPV